MKLVILIKLNQLNKYKLSLAIDELVKLIIKYACGFQLSLKLTNLGYTRFATKFKSFILAHKI